LPLIKIKIFGLKSGGILISSIVADFFFN